MAEAFLNSLGKGRFHAESAGLEPAETNPLVVQAMEEVGYPLEIRKGNSILEFFKEGRLYDFVVYVCASENADRCPVFPGVREIPPLAFPGSFQIPGLG